MAKFEDHPLTELLVRNGVPKVSVQLYPGMTPGRVASRRPIWRARDGEWSIRETGCPHFIALNDAAWPKYRVWTSDEYVAWEAAK